jgi:plastocyanin
MGVAACGGDDSGSAPAAEEPQAAATSTVVKVGVAGPVRFDKKRYTAKSGSVRIEITNPNRIGHNARVQRAEDPCCTEHDIGGTNTVSDGQSHAANVALDPGRYTVYCSLGGHWQRGMKAKLIVDE